jgi:hypothetical protein
MTRSTKTLAAALVAAAVPLYVAPASAAPLSQSLALNNNVGVGTVEAVQYRRWNDRWIGPAAAGLAAGAIIGGALASRPYGGYYAYGAAPGAYYAYGAAPGYVAAPRYRIWENYGNGSAATGPGSLAICPADRDDASAYPSWACY